MHEIVLHQWEMSPFCNKVRRCLKHKGLEFRVVNYNGLLARKAKQLSPAGTLPVLDYDGERIADSTHIAHYLDRKLPAQPLYPHDRWHLAQVCLWEDWAGQSLYFFEVYLRMLVPAARAQALDLITQGRPRYERALVDLHLRRHYPKKLAEQGIGRLTPLEVERRFIEHLEMIEAALDGREVLVGTAPSVADFSVAAQLDEIVRTSHLRERVLERKNIARWLERL